MAWILSIPIEIRLALLCVVGLFVGGQINRGIYCLNYFGQPLGPWRSPSRSATRKWWHYLPIVGWFGVRKERPEVDKKSPESEVHRLYWVRPIFIEVACAIGLPALYYFEVEGGLLPVIAQGANDAARFHATFLAHAILCGLMVIATFIDFDEQTIPDEITIPGVVLGLTLAALLPTIRLPDLITSVAGYSIFGMRLTSPNIWIPWLDGVGGLACGIACIWAWAAAILPKTITFRKGLLRTIPLMVASVVRPKRKTNRPENATMRRPFRLTWIVLAVAISGTIGIVGVWLWGQNPNYTIHWESLLSALVGMVFAAAIIWGVRIVGTHALGVEAMGFGDVTLMAMIGAFLGWQASLLVFFLAPFAAIFIAVTQFLVTRRNDLAFGPYLCFGALLLIVGWGRIWHNWVDQYFMLGDGWLIPVMSVALLILMGVMLYSWRTFKERVLFRDES